MKTGEEWKEDGRLKRYSDARAEKVKGIQDGFDKKAEAAKGKLLKKLGKGK